MKLLLMRHAIAENGIGKEDKERLLTEKGRQQLHQYAQYMKPLFQQFTDLRLWTSPLYRARETMDLIKAINQLNQKVEVYDFIHTGKFDQLEINLSQSEGADGVLIVGHQPNLSLWTEEMTSQYIQFKKASLAILDVESDLPLIAHLDNHYRIEDFNQL